ncbi:hypothetical protein RKD23_007958 [Streptomyces sp. SAI-170]
MGASFTVAGTVLYHRWSTRRAAAEAMTESETEQAATEHPPVPGASQ